MTTVATVISVSGLVWVQNTSGEQRLLVAGDMIQPDETLVTMPSTQLVVDFGNGKWVRFSGAEVGNDTDELVLAEIPVILLPNPSAGEEQDDSQPDRSSVMPEGHFFVQLVRIAEMIEADGLTPLNVAAIQEQLNPLLMDWSRPEEEPDEERYNRGGDRDYVVTAVDTVAPGVSIELQGAGPDGIYDDQEIGADGTVTAEITLLPGTEIGDLLVVIDKDGNVLLNRPVTQDDLNNGIRVEVPVQPGDSEVTVNATITDPSGNSGSDNDDKPIEWPVKVIVPDNQDAVQPDGNITDQVVFESGLSNGSSPNSYDLKIDSSLTLRAFDGLDETVALRFDYTDSGGNPATLELPREQIENLASSPQTLTTEYGELILNGYTQNPDGILTIDYEYILTSAPDNSDPKHTDEHAFDNISITVNDRDGGSDSATLSIKIIDDAPVAEDDTNEIDEDGVATVTGNVMGGAGVSGGDVADSEGADGATVTHITSDNEPGNTSTDNGNGVLTIEGEYGTLTIHPDGSYSYALDNDNPEINALKDGQTLDEAFTYTLTDGDDDQDSATLTITINGKTDGSPVITPQDGNGLDAPDVITSQGHTTVNESGLLGGSTAGDNSHINTGHINISTPDGLGSLTIGDKEISLEALRVLDPNDPGTHIVIDTPAGKLTLTDFDVTDHVGDVPTEGDLSFTYELEQPQNTPAAPDDPEAGRNSTDNIPLVVTDAGGGTGTGELVINIIDDAPVAEDDTNSVTEGDDATSTSTARGNVIGTGGTEAPSAGDATDSTGADGATVTEIQFGTDEPETVPDGGSITIDGEYGTLTIHPDGSYTYELDNSNPTVQELIEGDKLDEVFTYTLTDGDGDSDTATLTITIHGQDDDVRITIPDPTDPDDPNYPVVNDPQDLGDPARGVVNDLVVFESGLSDGSSPNDNDIRVESNFTLSALDGLDESAALVIGGETLTRSQVEALNDTHVTINTHYGTLVLNGYTQNSDGTITIDYEYILISAPDNSDPGHENDHAFDNISITANDRDGDTDTQTLSIKIIDDTPTAGNQAEVELAEGGKTLGYIDNGSGSNTLTGGENLLANDTLGADDARVHQIQYVDGDGDPVVFQDENGDVVTLVTVPDNGSVTVTSPAGGTLTVYSNGDWRYTSPAAGSGSDDTAADHSSGDGANLPDGFQYNLIDSDGDISNWADQPINVIDTEPEIGTPENAAVDERHLATGTDPDSDAVTVGGSLAVTRHADGIDTAFATHLSYLEALGLESNGYSLSYAIGGDGKLVATANSQPVFTVEIINGDSDNARYEFTLQGPLDHYDSDGNELENIDIPFQFIVTDADGDTAEGEFTVTVTDDPPPETGGTEEMLPFDEGGTGTLNTPANAGGTAGAPITLPNNGNPSDTEDGAPRFGTVTVDPDTGNLTYTPTGPDFSGEDSFTYSYTPPGSSTPITTTVNVTVNPVADAPELEDDKSIVVNEDGIGQDTDNPTDPTGRVSLGLQTPIITDNDQVDEAGDFDHPERLGEITLTLSDDAPDGTGLVYTDGDGDEQVLTLNGSGGYSIIIVDADGAIDTSLHHRDLTAGDSNVNYLTQAEYESIQAQLDEHRHENFEVEVSVRSYEVDGDGEPLPDSKVGGNNGAESTQTIIVDVGAVTDEVELSFKDSGEITITGDGDSLDGIKRIETDMSGLPGSGDLAVWVNEDQSFNLSELLNAAFEDLDGSESRWLTLNGLAEGTTVEVGGQTYTANPAGELTISASSLGDFGNGESTTLPTITVTPPQDFSGDMTGITITLHGQDSDADSSVTPDVETDSVTLDLYVYPQGGDVEVENASGTEDAGAIAFLAGVSVTDTVNSTERITAVSFELPAGWVDTGGDENNWRIETPSGGEGSGWTVTSDGTTYTITAVDDYDLADILDEFSVSPPEHSSMNQDLKLTITTEDSNTVAGESESTTTEVTRDLTIEVAPEAEVIPDDATNPAGDDGDLRMTEGHDYETPGEEDEWFDLNQEGFNLGDRWFNADGRDSYGEHEPGDDRGSEDTYALLTPELLTGGAGVNANGSRFQWMDGDGVTRTATFTGDPIEVPVEYLHTLAFMAPPNFSGVFRIKVEALTKDYGDDDAPLETPSESISGEAWLQNVLIEPRAGSVSADIDRRVREPEGEPMALNIRPTSSDPGEAFDLTLSGIPDGATIHYDGAELTVTDGSVTIENFDPAAELTITPPEMNNTEFTLGVEITAKDILWLTDDGTPTGNSLTPEEGVEFTDADGNSYPTENGKQFIRHDSDAFTSTITVDPIGVADGVGEINWLGDLSWDEGDQLATGYTITEQDAETGGIALDGLIGGATLVDSDGSETLSATITGLPPGVTLVGGAPLGGGTWAIDLTNLGNVRLVTPNNFKGELNFTLTTTTTENDGNSTTQEWPVSLTVTPSPEATMTLTTGFNEDQRASVDFFIVHQNGDTDETLTAVWIDVGSIHDKLILYYVDSGGNPTELTSGMDVSGWPGVEWDNGELKLTGDAIGRIQAEGDANWHSNGPVNAFNVRYEITDTVTVGGSDITETRVTNAGNYRITVNPVTDQVTLTVDSGESHTLDAPGSITIGLIVGNDDGNGGSDYDGSEALTRIILDNVPAGVVLAGIDGLPGGVTVNIHYAGDGTWIAELSGAALTDPLSPQLRLDVSSGANGISGDSIGITVITEDAGNGDESRASQQITLTTEFDEPDDPEEEPAEIVLWVQSTDFVATEDVQFTLAEAIDAQIDGSSGFTITLTDLPPGTEVSGMTRTVINGEEVWTASDSGGQAELNALLNTIRITPPENWNSGEAGTDTFDYTATLTTHVANGDHNQKSEDMEQVVIPVTDNASIAIHAPEVNEGQPVNIGITVTNPTDQPNWTLVDDKVYVQLETFAIGDGTLTYDGTELTPETINEHGLSGDYYVINVPVDWQPGDLLDLVFAPDEPHARGELGITVAVVGQEAGADNFETSTNDTTTAIINPENNGYEFTVGSGDDDTGFTVTGFENNGANGNTGIQLPITGGGLVDVNNEELITALLRNLPNDFLVYAGTDADSAELATNAGGTWQIPLSGGQLPNYISILPPQHWSGTIENLELVLVSGEVEPPREDRQFFDLVVDPVADGITLAPNPSFGTEGEIITFNFNADFIDARQEGDTDASVEAATLEIRGLGEHTAFYIGNTLIDAGQISYSDGVWTITGLSRGDLGNLGFVQAADEIDGTLQIRGRTQEYEVDGEGSANLNEPVGEPSDWSNWETIQTTINEQFATGGNDTLLWTGSLIDGRGGDDTIQLRYAETLSGEELADNLRNIEVIDMTGRGADRITSLSIEDVLNMTDSRNTLRISGDAEDSVQLELDGGWSTGETNAGYITYTGMHNGNTVTLEVQNTLID
jgi:T1SS-143 domain-containing protein